MNKKYELLQDDTIVSESRETLYRIRALRSLWGVKEGDLGGYIAGEHNLDHEGDAWVSDSAWVFGNARVYGNAQVYGDAKVYGDTQVYDDARVSGN